jgi:toxin YoeB
MYKSWSDNGWEDYLYWQMQDRKTLRRVNDLIHDIERSPFSGKGKPEPLKYERHGYWSRRINETDRLIYRVIDGVIEIVSCRSHYDD